MTTSLSDSSTAYVAFLRGINVGGHKKIKMAELKKAFESLGYRNVRTVLASGNVIFEAQGADSHVLASTIEEMLEKTFGFEVPVILRPLQAIVRMADSSPFANIQVTQDTRLYVTFLNEKSKGSLNIPYESPDGAYKILQVSDGAVLSVLTLSPDRRTVDSMNVLEKEFGRNITTRNWNTLERVLRS